MRFLALAVMAVVFSVASISAAEAKVTLSGVHLCCGSCVKGVAAATKDTGATVTADMETKKVVIVGKDEKEAKAAVDALSTAGFYGVSDNKDIAMKPAEPTEGKVKSMDFSTHNCCPKCTKAIDAVAKKAEGVTEVAATPKEPAVSVKGDFDAKAEAKVMNDAGFQVNKK